MVTESAGLSVSACHLTPQAIELPNTDSALFVCLHFSELRGEISPFEAETLTPADVHS